MNSTQHSPLEDQTSLGIYRTETARYQLPPRIKLTVFQKVCKSDIREMKKYLKEFLKNNPDLADREVTGLTLFLCIAQATRRSKKHKGLQTWIQRTEQHFQQSTGIQVKLKLYDGKLGAQVEVMSGIYEYTKPFKRLLTEHGKVLV